jgi:uncharacterized membrane protein
MEKITRQGQLLFAMAVTAFGALHLIWARFGEAVVPVVPWIPGKPLLAYLLGIIFLIAGLNLAANLRPQQTSLLLGIVFLISVLVLWAPKVAASPFDVGVRTRAFETLAICGSALTLAAGLALSRPASTPKNRTVEFLVNAGPYLFAISSIVFGIDHFLVLRFIVGLIPAWIPAASFWSYFTGVFFIAAGICIAIRWLDVWAGTVLGIMFLLWFLILHAPRVMSAPHSHNPNEWSSAFITLGLCGGSWICAWYAQARQRPVPSA